MKQSLLAALRPVRGRQQSVFVVRCLIAGLLATAAVGLAAGVARTAFAVEFPAPLVGGLLAAGPLVGLLVGLVVRRDDHGAAAAIDAHYGLKDRTVTALAFANQPAGDLHELQFSDAMAHLHTVEPKAVVPLTLPKAWPLAAGGVALATALLVWPLTPREAEAGPAPTPDHIVAMVEGQKDRADARNKRMEETIQDTDELTEEEKAGVKEWIQKVKDRLDELSQDAVTEQEALAKLSEMSAEKQALATMLNPAALEGSLASLGTALAASQPFEGAGKALMKGDLEKAAKELDKLQEVTLTPKEAKDLEQKLREQQKKAGDAGQGSLGEAIGEFADAVKGGGNGKVGQAGKNLAKKVNSAIRKRKIANLLNDAEEDYKEGKCDCQNSGGQKVKKTEKSNSPSSNWGRGVSGNTEGERTKLGGKRNELQVTGTPGDEGDSDTETTTTPEAREQARKKYEEKFKKGEKESKAVLESEPIPLGHRQTVKKYFEMIRPSGGDAFEKKDEPKPEAKPADKK